jgi:hypothetical protein
MHIALLVAVGLPSLGPFFLPLKLIRHFVIQHMPPVFGAFV